jgi:hypothetical protein
MLKLVLIARCDILLPGEPTKWMAYFLRLTGSVRGGVLDAGIEKMC